MSDKQKKPSLHAPQLPSKRSTDDALVPKQDNYLTKIYQAPLLSAEEELKLARAWREQGSLEASYKLVTSHLRLVPKIAARFKNYGLPAADLIAEGNIGLMHAVKKFDPEKGYRLTTYALWWIRAAIQEYILSAWSLVKIATTPERKKLFFSLQSRKKQIEAYEKGDLLPKNLERLETDMQVNANEIIAVNRAITGKDLSLNHIAYEGQPEPIELLESERPSPEEEVFTANEKLYRKQLLYTALRQLNERDRDIFVARQMSSPAVSLKELGEKFSISRERVRQLEARAAKTIKELVQEQDRQ